jgi:hypothetical protein
VPDDWVEEALVLVLDGGGVETELLVVEGSETELVVVEGSETVGLVWAELLVVVGDPPPPAQVLAPVVQV